MVVNLKHLNRYINFIHSRKFREISEGSYTEKHHVIPYSYYGKFEKEKLNIIKLTAREHFIAHLILWKAFSGKFVNAFYIMQNHSCKNGERYFKLTSRQYEKLRMDFSKQKSKELKGKTWEELYGEEKAKLMKKNHSEYRKRYRHSKETKDKISESHKKVNKDWMKGENNPSKNIEVGKKISKHRKNKNYEEIYGEEKAKLMKNSLSKNARNNPNYGMKGKKHSEDQKKKMRNIIKNKKTIHKGDIHKRVDLKNVDNYLDRGWSLGFSEKEKQKRSKSNNNKKRSEEQKENYSRAQKNMIVINNRYIQTRIKKDSLDEYLKKGWVKGRLNFTKDHKEKIKKANLGKKAISKNGIRTRVNKEDLEDYLKQGWIIGWK